MMSLSELFHLLWIELFLVLVNESCDLVVIK